MNDFYRDLHTEDVKVRLTAIDASLMKGMANHRDVPVSVVARMIIVRGAMTWAEYRNAPPSRGEC